MIDKILFERKADCLNETEGSPLTIEALVSLIGEDSFTIFFQELLGGKTNLFTLQVTQTSKDYLNSLKENRAIVESIDNKTIPYREYVQGFKK